MEGDRRERGALLAIAIAGCLCVAVMLADARADATIRVQQGPLVRGAILDRLGRPLAYSDSSASGPRVRFALSNLTQVLGHPDANGSWTGIEGKYSRLLSAASQRHAASTWFQNLFGGLVRGDNVTLTLDRHVQQVADRALGRHMGAAVAIDPRTGAVLALVSQPYCRLDVLQSPQGIRGCRESPDKPLMNRATDQLFAPGSTFKIVTLSAALATGRFHLTDLFSGVDAFGPSPYFDNSEYPSNVTRPDLTTLTLAQGLAFSDNFMFAHVGLALGSRTLLAYARRFGLNQRLPFDLPVRRSSIDHGARVLTAGETARASFGAEDDAVTPLQMAMIVSAVADHGTLMTPYLVSHVDTAGGQRVMTAKPRVFARVLSRSVAARVTDGMVFVVTDGSGFNAAIPGVQVAGKTGTAASGGPKPNAWFISFAPARNPRVAVAVLVQYSGEGFQYAAPVARRIMEAALAESAHATKYSGGSL